MNALQFRAILVGYLTLLVLNFLLRHLTHRSANVPKEYAFDSLRFQSRTGLGLFYTFFVGVLVVAVTGFIGMFFFWSTAPRLFAFATIIKTIAWPFFVRADAGPPSNEWQKACSSLEAVLDGILIAVTLIGSAKPLFGDL